jgi:hypothetical protein
MSNPKLFFIFKHSDDDVSYFYDVVNAFGNDAMIREFSLNSKSVKTFSHDVITEMRKFGDLPFGVLCSMPPISNTITNDGITVEWDGNKLGFMYPEKSNLDGKRVVVNDYLGRKYDLAIEMALFTNMVSLDMIDNMLSVLGINFAFWFSDENSNIALSKINRFKSFINLDRHNLDKFKLDLLNVNNMGN